VKLCNVEIDGELRAAVLIGGRLIAVADLWVLLPREQGASWPSAGSAWDERSLPLVPRLAAALESADLLDRRAISGLDPARTRLGPPVHPVPGFRDFYAFEQHVKTARGRRGLEMIPAWYDAPVFYFSNTRSIVGHGAAVQAPPGGDRLDYELEVACVIGRGGRDIDPADADGHVAGYAVLNDWSLRDVQRHEMQVGLGPAKGKDFATSLGPYLVTPDELADRRAPRGYRLAMTARVNGRELSRGSWDSITFDFREMIARASQGVTLYPGEVLGSGTVGSGCILELGPENTGGWLKPGDVVELEIERLGVLRNEIVE
jgi:fumarylacetoacetate (FAA) hydrolase